MTFALCFEAHRADGRVWAVKAPVVDIDDGHDWILTPRVSVECPVRTMYRDGPTQPRAYLHGHCDRLDITAEGVTIR